MLQNDNVVLACFIGEAFFWIGAYVLIVRRSFSEHIHGMPAAAMCGNIGWEWLLGLGIFKACPIYWDNCRENVLGPLTLLAGLVDAVILFTVLRFGRAQFRHPLVRRHWPLLVTAGVILGIALNYLVLKSVFLENVLDEPGENPAFLPDGVLGGILSGWGLALIMGILFIALIISRNGVQGQSVYIAAFMGLGNLFAFLFDLSTAIRIPTLIYVLVAATLALNALYAVMVYRRTVALGLDPLRRA